MEPLNAPTLPTLCALSPPAMESAVAILEVLPALMGSLRHEMAHEKRKKLTIVQFRTLTILNNGGMLSLSTLAQRMEMGLPATSKVVEGLVQAALIHRQVDASDRRKISLQISDTGVSELNTARLLAREHLAKILAPLSPQEHKDVSHTMNTLRTLVRHRTGHCS